MKLTIFTDASSAFQRSSGEGFVTNASRCTKQLGGTHLASFAHFFQKLFRFADHRNSPICTHI